MVYSKDKKQWEHGRKDHKAVEEERAGSDHGLSRGPLAKSRKLEDTDGLYVIKTEVKMRVKDFHFVGLDFANKESI